VGYVGLTAIVWFLLHLALQGFEKKWRVLAATIQEVFDTRVLDLPWNEAVVGPKPPPEAVAWKPSLAHERKGMIPCGTGMLPM